MSNLEFKGRYRRRLPHIQPAGATLFVTFRLAGSIPRGALERWRSEKQHLGLHSLDEATRHLQPPSLQHLAQATSLRRELNRQFFRKMEKLLHEAKAGPEWLKDRHIAQMVADSLHYREGKVYRLDAFCIMPNHVHVVFKPLPMAQAGSLRDVEYYSLAAIMHSLKGYTAGEANRLLGRGGAFWEHESYDHFVRDTEEHKRIVDYVLNNPVKAGLVGHWQDWPWNYQR